MAEIIVDSWAWAEYLSGNHKVAQAMEGKLLKTPALAFAELYRSFKRKGLADEKIEKALQSMASKSIVLALDAKQAILAGKIAAEENMHLSDAIIYSYTTASVPVLTGDADFRGRQKVIFISG